MWENIIGRHIRRTSRNLFLTACGAICVVALLAFPYARYWRNVFAGPLDASPEMLLGVQEPDSLDRYYVRLSGVKATDLGLQDVNQEVDKSTGEVTSETVEATYFIIPMSGRILLVKSPTPTAQAEYTGALVNIPEGTRNRIAKEMQKDNQNFSDVFLPFMLDANDFTSWGYGALAASALLIIGAVFLMMKAARRASDPASSPIVKSLARYGDRPEGTAAEIDADVAQSGFKPPTYASWLPGKGSLTISNSWILKPELFDLKIINLKDLFWVYEKVTTHRMYFVVPISKRSSAILRDRYGSVVECAAGHSRVLEILSEIDLRAPWVVVGYTKEREQLYKTQLSEFAKVVDDRRAGMKTSG
jgi:hypothetical protein